MKDLLICYLCSFYGFTKTYCNDNETCLDQICEAALLCESYERSDSTTLGTYQISIRIEH